MTDTDIEVANLQAEIAIQKAEKAANQAKQSTEDLERLQQALSSPQVKEANRIAAEEASKAAMDSVIKNKKTESEVKVRVANQLIEQANSAKLRAEHNKINITPTPKIIKKQKPKKKNNITRKIIFVGIALAILVFIAVYKNPKQNIKPRSIIV
jgi:hypothetical protein